MGLRLRQILLALVLSLAILGAIMASSSPTNLALGATTTCGINGCVSTPSIVSSTSYSYLGTTISITSTTSTKFSTSISSSTTTTSATTTSTFFSYTSTISTSITTTSYSTQITGTQTSTNTNWVTVPTTTTTSSTYTNVVTKQGTSVSCPVALVTAGNWLEPYANFLRNFRNNEIQNTTAGRAFMLTFNNWYYFWAPSLSNSAASNPWIFKAVQGGVYPLIGILYASYYSYTLIAPLSPEAAAITAGVVASSLIGSLFVAPIAYATLRLTRRGSPAHLKNDRWALRSVVDGQRGNVRYRIRHKLKPTTCPRHV